MASLKMDFSEIRQFTKGIVDAIRNSTDGQAREINGRVSIKFNAYKEGSKLKICEGINKTVLSDKIEIHCSELIEVNKVPPLNLTFGAKK